MRPAGTRRRHSAPTGATISPQSTGNRVETGPLPQAPVPLPQERPDMTRYLLLAALALTLAGCGGVPLIPLI